MTTITQTAALAATYRKLALQNRNGLHARPAAMIVRIASSHPYDVYATYGDLRVNCKSIMGLMMLAAGMGAELTFEAYGPDTAASAILDRIEVIINRKFDEV